MIEAKNLSKIFQDQKRGTIHAVADISITCHPGQIYGLLGPNGAGKTTFMRMLATVLSPSSGAATVAGYDVVRNPGDVRANIGYMSNATALYERLTPRQIVTYFGQLNGLYGRSLVQRIGAIFERLDICAFADSKCEKLSTGQKQRVSIARTIIHEPKVLIFDEPTNGLDILASRTIVTFIKECRADGRTVLFSTHILSEIEELCDTIGIINSGRLVAQGTQDELRVQTDQTNLHDIFLSVMGVV